MDDSGNFLTDWNNGLPILNYLKCLSFPKMISEPYDDFLRVYVGLETIRKELFVTVLYDLGFCSRMFL